MKQRPRSPWRPLTEVLVLTVVTAFCHAARASDETPSGPDSTARVIILATGPQEFISGLKEAVEAHLSSFSATVDTCEVGPLPPSFPRQADLVRQIARDSSAIAVAWADPDHATFFVMLTDDLTQGRFLERRLPENQDGWIAACDGLASMVTSAILPRLTRPEKEDATVTAVPEAGPDDVQGDEESPFEEDLLMLGPTKEPLSVSLLATAGYGLDVINSNGGFQHGARLNWGIMLVRHLELLAGLDLLVPLDAQGDTEGADDIRLSRWPLRFQAGGFLTLNKIDLGLRMGVLVDFLRVLGLEDNNFVAVRESRTRRTNPGFTAGILIRANLLRWVHLWIEGQVDLMEWAYNFHMNSTTDETVKNVVIEYGGIHVGVMGGMGFVFDVQ